MNRSYSKIRHIQEANIRLENRLLSEQQFESQTGNPDEQKIIDYVKKQWGLNSPESIEQNSAMIEIINKNGSKIRFNIQKHVIEYDKNWAIDPTPIPINSTFDQFKKWFDSNNNYNPLSGMM